MSSVKHDNILEDVFDENAGRWVLLPIHYPQIWEMYKKILESFWTCEDYGFEKSMLNVLETPNAALVDAVAKFATDCLITLGDPSQSHGYLDVTELTSAFLENIQVPEARAYLGFQAAFENIHRETLSQWVISCKGNILEEGVSDGLKQHSAFLKSNLGTWYSGVASESSVGDQMDSEGTGKENMAGNANVKKLSPVCDKKSAGPARILAAIVCMKAFQFAGLWLLSSMLEDSPFKKSAQLMHRDWMLHANFAALIYSSLIKKLPAEEAASLVEECANIQAVVLTNSLGMIPAFEKEVPIALNAIRRWAIVALGGKIPAGDVGDREWVLPELRLESRSQPFKTDRVEETKEKVSAPSHGLSLDSDF